MGLLERTWALAAKLRSVSLHPRPIYLGNSTGAQSRRCHGAEGEYHACLTALDASISLALHLPIILRTRSTAPGSPTRALRAEQDCYIATSNTFADIVHGDQDNGLAHRCRGAGARAVRFQCRRG